MKTITLTDEAYDRLKSWKSRDADSFSKVVLSVVPKKGTAADMEEAFSQLHPLSAEEEAAVAESHRWANRWDREEPFPIPAITTRRPDAR